MCRGVVIHERDGSEREFGTQGELAAALGGAQHLVFPEGHSFEPEVCLCPVDTKATAERLGYSFYPVCSYVDDDGFDDPFNEHFVR